MQVLDDGGYAFSHDLDIPGEGSGDFCFARGWLLEIVDKMSGDYAFFSDGVLVRPSGRRFGVFYPPFTFVRAYSNNIKGYVRGVGSAKVIDDLPGDPFVFETDYSEELTSIDQARDVLASCRDRRSIVINTGPSPVSLKAKRLIDENHLVYPSIARIAARVKVSHEHLSRQFKKDYGITPSAYLHKLRVAEATFRLSRGEEIIDISQDVGYNDLSRFYKQFRKATRTSPGVCRRQVSG
jgi:AraC-like DNA-binding protein